MSDVSFLLHPSTQDQRDFGKEIASDGIITYSLSDNHDDIHANWFKRIFHHINNLTGVIFKLTNDRESEIHYIMTISNEDLNQKRNRWESIQISNKNLVSYMTNHREKQYGGVNAQLEVSRSIIKSLGVSFPNGCTGNPIVEITQ